MKPVKVIQWHRTEPHTRTQEVGESDDLFYQIPEHVYDSGDTSDLMFEVGITPSISLYDKSISLYDKTLHVNFWMYEIKMDDAKELSEAVLQLVRKFYVDHHKDWRGEDEARRG